MDSCSSFSVCPCHNKSALCSVYLTSMSMPVFSLLCPACYIPLARWGHTPRPLLNFDMSNHLIKMLILSQPLQVSSHCWYTGCTQRKKKKFLKEHCRSNLSDVSCHVFGHQSLSVKKPRNGWEVGSEEKGEMVSYLAISNNQIGITFRCGEYSSTVLKQKGKSQLFSPAKAVTNFKTSESF